MSEQKTILVTGASSGIGRQTALALARQGHRVIMHGRDPEKTERARAWVAEQAGSREVGAMVADLSLMGEVARFADRFAATHERLDVLVNNAGGQFGSTREVTAEGHERTLAINTLAPFLLTQLLLPLLAQAPAARVVTVSSESYRQAGRPLLDDIELECGYSMVRAYAFSKLYAWWVMRQFSERLAAAGVGGVSVNTCEPGSAVTSLQRESLRKTPWMAPLVALWLPFMRTARHGARTSVYLATSPEVEGVSGGFYGRCRPKRVAGRWLDPAGERRVWDFCMEACAPQLAGRTLLVR